MHNEFRPTTLKDVREAVADVEKNVQMPDDVDNDGDDLNAECNLGSYSRDQLQSLRNLEQVARDYFVDNEGHENRRAVTAAGKHGIDVSVTEDEEDPYVTHIHVELPNGESISTTTGRV